MQLRFRLDQPNECYRVYAFKRGTRKWEQIGTCHLMAKEAIKRGRIELIQTNFTRAK